MVLSTMQILALLLFPLALGGVLAFPVAPPVFVHLGYEVHTPVINVGAPHPSGDEYHGDR